MVQSIILCIVKLMIFFWCARWNIFFFLFQRETMKTFTPDSSSFVFKKTITGYVNNAAGRMKKRASKSQEPAAKRSRKGVDESEL